MKITPIFILYFTYVFYIFITSKKIKDFYINLLFLTCVLEIGMFQGYAIRIGGSSISLLQINTLVFMFVSLIFFIKITNDGIKKQCVILLIVIFIYMVLQILYNDFNPYKGLVLNTNISGCSWDYYAMGFCKLYPKKFNFLYSIKGSIKLFYLLINAYIIKTKISFNDFNYVIKNMIFLFKIIVLFGLFEFVCKNVLHTPYFPFKVASFLLGNDSQAYSAPTMRGRIYALQGLCCEPSHFNICLFSFLLLLIIYERINNDRTKLIKKILKNFWFISGVILMFFSGGVSCIWCIAILFIEYYIVTRKNTKHIKRYNYFRFLKFIGISLFILIILFGLMFISNSNYIARIFGMIETVLNISKKTIETNLIRDMSTYSRFLSIKTCFENFLERPIFGLGAGFVECHDSTVSFLVQFGLIGFLILFSIFVFPNSNGRKYDKFFIIMCIFFYGVPYGNPGSIYSFVYNILIIELTSFYLLRFNTNSIHKLENVKWKIF